MEHVEIKLNSGTIQKCKYTRQEFETTGKIKYNRVVADIFRYVCVPKDIDDPIYWIKDAKLNPGFTLSNLMDEYRQQFSDHELILAQAGTIFNDIPAEGSIDGPIKEVMKNHRDQLFSAGFVNVIFNRKMKHSFMNSDIFIYFNFACDVFINDNIGDAQSGEIINHYVLGSKR